MFGLSLLLCFIAFLATILSGLIKLIFFFNKKDTYRKILKYALIGEILGVLISLGITLIYRSDMNDGLNEVIAAIPFYTMLLGLVTGTIVTILRVYKTNS